MFTSIHPAVSITKPLINEDSSLGSLSTIYQMFKNQKILLYFQVESQVWSEIVFWNTGYSPCWTAQSSINGIKERVVFSTGSRHKQNHLQKLHFNSPRPRANHSIRDCAASSAVFVWVEVWKEGAWGKDCIYLTGVCQTDPITANFFCPLDK